MGKKNTSGAATVETPAPSTDTLKGFSVPASSYDPAAGEVFANNNKDRPVYTAPRSRTFQEHFGHMNIKEGAGESRPMFAQSEKE